MLRPARALLVAWALACARDERPVDIPLEPYIGRLVTVDALAGTDTLRLIFDTGGGETIISPRAARRLGCTPSGRSIGFRMNGERIATQMCPSVTLIIGGVPFAHSRIAVWDVAAVLPQGAPPVDGVLSLKTFAAQPFTLVLAEGRLTLETPVSVRRRVTEMTRLTSRIATGTDGDELTVFVRGAVRDTAWFLLDSGNLDVVQIAPHVAGSTTPADTWESELRLDGIPAVRTTFRQRDMIYDGALSEAVLRMWTLTFDLADNAVWIARSGSSH